MRKTRSLLLACALAGLFSGSLYAQLSDVTQPGDPLVPSSNNSPGSEGVANAIDNTDNKYLNFDGANNAVPTGFTVTPRVGLTVVQCLTLKSANDAADRDPANYTLEGSYDGTTFTPISSGAVPAFTARFQKVVICFSNDTPYLSYRLLFPLTAGPSTCCMQIAEVELLGFLAPTDVTQPGDPLVASSNNSPGSEGVANAIDNTDNKYLNFDGANNAVPTGFTVTPAVGGTLVTGITLKSANDAADRDPSTYTLEGSLDGTTFYPIASGSVPAFPTRFYKHYIFFSNARAYKSYRLLFPLTGGPSTCCMQIAEVELLGTVADLAQDVTQPGDPIVGSSNNSPGSEGVANAIDNTDNKYLNFDGANNAVPTGFTVTPRAGLTLVSGLTLKSANDAADRDPANYTLEGSYDGVNFTMISSGSVAPFPTRFATQTFLFDNKIPYLQYRVIFPLTAGPSTCCMQIAEVELLGVLAPSDVTVPGDPLVASSNNSPGSEGVGNAIDNTDNKYLNFDGANNTAPTGFTVTPGVGDTIVTGITLKSANDAADRDPANYELSGSNDGANYVPISSGTVPPFPTRFYKNYIFFPDNTKSFKSYRLLFPLTAGPSTCCMQIAEVEFLGVTPGVVNTNPVSTLIRRQPQDTPVLLGSAATLRVLLTGPWKVQWYTNGVRIPGANNATYTTAPATAADDGLRYQALVQSPQGQQLSDEVLLSIFTPSATASVGLNWRGSGANGAPTDMLPSDITGFHPQAYWNNLTGGSGSLPTPLNSANAPSTITVDWATSGEWAAGTGNDDATARLLNGIMTSFATDLSSAQTVTFSGVPAGTHSLLVYTVQVPKEFFNMNFQVVTYDAGGAEVVQDRYLRPQNSDEYNPSPGFILATATSAATRSVGNMLRFDNLQPGPDGRIIVRFYAPGRAQPPGAEPIRGPGVNGMQLLLNPGPAVEPPVITQAPVSKNGTVGGQVVLTVAASGPDLTYQWLRNGQPIQGATGPELVLLNLSTNDIGKYSVAVENASGRVVSPVAAVDVLQSELLTEGLILYYTFDDRGGDSGLAVTDSAPGANHGGVRGTGLPDWPDGLYGAALRFDGAAYAVTPTFPKPSAAMTVAGWILGESQNFGPIINNWVQGNPTGSRGQFQVDLLTGPILNSQIAVGPNAPSATGPVTADLFDWHHFALTANGNTLSAYWDGVLIDSEDYLGALNTGAALPFPWLVIGADLAADTNTAPARVFTGQLDDIALWGRSLSDEEIAAIALSGRPLSEVPPVITVAPRLNIYWGATSVTISWRADFTGFVLETSPSVATPVWTPVPGVANNSVTIANPTGTAFFRLKK